MRNFEYKRADDLEGAIALQKGAAESRYLAGGTTLMDLAKLEVERPDRVVDIGRLPLGEIEELEDGGFRVGAMARNSHMAWHAGLSRAYPVLSQALLSGASPQLRNMATCAGNLMQRTRCPYFRDNYSDCNKREPGSGCAAISGYNRMHAILGGSSFCVATHPSDMCVALLALDATVEVKSKGRRRIPISAFHRLPGDAPYREHALRGSELITAVLIPPLDPDTRSVYLKSRDRQSYEFALASVAVVSRTVDKRFSDVRIALGGVATKPWRASEAEDVLLEEEPSVALFEKAADCVLENAEPLQHNGFKVALVKRLMVRALCDVTGKEAS